MGEIVLKIPQRVARQYTLTKEYAAQILAELDLKSRRLKSNPDETEKLAELKKLMAGYRKNPPASVKQSVKTAERLRAGWDRK
jgi:hypothetical protein